MHVCGAPDCCPTVIVCAATVRLPCRNAPVFAATANFSEPFPDPLLAPTIVMNAAELVAVQEQPTAVLIDRVNSPPAERTGSVGVPLTVKLQFAGVVIVGWVGELLPQLAGIMTMPIKQQNGRTRLREGRTITPDLHSM